MLVVVILFLFLGDLRSSLIVSANLVLTPLLTFLVMNSVGLSANLMSLGGLAIAIGLMVDGSVVVVENVFGKAEPREAWRAPNFPRARSCGTILDGGERGRDADPVWCDDYHPGVSFR